MQAEIVFALLILMIYAFGLVTVSVSRPWQFWMAMTGCIASIVLWSWLHTNRFTF